MSTTQKRLPKRIKIAFGVGSIGELVYLGMFNTFIGIFYNQAIGLSNSLIGTAVMLALLGDAVSDPIAGLISDRWRSRFGRRHPFLFLAPLPLAVALYFIFNPPDSLTDTATVAENSNQLLLFAWLTFWTIISRLCATLYTVPHLALGGELTKDQNERSSVFSINTVIGYTTGALFAFTAWGYFLAGETLNAEGVSIPRHLDPTAYGPLVFTACGLVLSTIWLCAFGTLSQVKHLSTAPIDRERLSVSLFFREIWGALKNRNYAVLLIGFFCFMISVGLFETFGVFVNTYFWELKPEDIRWFGLAAAPAALAGALAAPVLMRRFDRRPVLLGALITVGVFAQIAIDLRLLGWFPSNESPLLLPLLVAGSSTLSLALGIAVVAILSMLGDIIDENELATGRRQEGLFYSARAFFAKAANSFGHLLAGVMLDVFVHMPFEAVPGQVDADVIARLGIAGGPVMGAASLIAVFFYARYDLSRDRHAEIIAAIAKRHAEAKSAVVQSPG